MLDSMDGIIISAAARIMADQAKYLEGRAEKATDPTVKKVLEQEADKWNRATLSLNEIVAKIAGNVASEATTQLAQLEEMKTSLELITGQIEELSDES